MNFLLIISFCLFYFQLCNSITVQTNDGKVKGFVEQSGFFKKPINIFKGIRYAQPPIGQLRFKKPMPIKQWNDVYNANKFGPTCWQKSGSNHSEDCLFLNIYTPYIPSNRSLSNETLRPVMFFIHGGYFTSGSGNINGIELASHDVVLVTHNYRLGIFGFLYGGNDDAPGNVGLHDQLLALKWVIKMIFINESIFIYD